ncbi:hypothetical protein AAH994_01460 [Weeksellaceae bacterium A-14]
MKRREKNVLIAGGVGIAAAMGFLVLRKFLRKNLCDPYYNDFQMLFSKGRQPEDQHGIEYFSVL